MILVGAIYTPNGTAFVIIQALSSCAPAQIDIWACLCDTVAQARNLGGEKPPG
ncbi:hypothetical protein KDA_75580 [Dictyobacter alpinus]|uniref:Uncharacterized protein n=1 Tax=Dictyobacter alpinus TaxID=2014873 RepID=A0A402BL48_9CHLR|nr:hypothetical protein KDA_75580 [Dictyobacter alpinus]